MISLGGGTTIKVLSLGADFARFKIKIEGNIRVEAGSIRREKNFAIKTSSLRYSSSMDCTGTELSESFLSKASLPSQFTKCSAQQRGFFCKSVSN